MLETQALYPGLQPFPACCLRRRLSQHDDSEVWEAENENGPLAIKFSACRSDRPVQRELEFLLDFSRVGHPHLISIRLVWCYRNYIVIGMELAYGGILDLLKLFQNEFGALFGARQVCGYMSQAAEALDFLNNRKHLINGQRVTLQHGNIKPSNLLLIGDKLKLAELKQASQTTSDGSAQRLADTLRYAAPEVFQGRPSHIHRADQYALAVTYCHLRGGRLPFLDTPETLDADYIRPVPDLTMLPPASRPIIARALAPDPEDRWPTCSELIAQLTKVVS